MLADHFNIAWGSLPEVLSPKSCQLAQKCFLRRAHFWLIHSVEHTLLNQSYCFLWSSRKTHSKFFRFGTTLQLYFILHFTSRAKEIYRVFRLSLKFSRAICLDSKVKHSWIFKVIGKQQSWPSLQNTELWSQIYMDRSKGSNWSSCFSRFRRHPFSFYFKIETSIKFAWVGRSTENCIKCLVQHDDPVYLPILTPAAQTCFRWSNKGFCLFSDFPDCCLENMTVPHASSW